LAECESREQMREAAGKRRQAQGPEVARKSSEVTLPPFLASEALKSFVG